MNPDVQDIYLKRIGFQLIRLHVRENLTVYKNNDLRLLENMKWPIECK